MVIFYASLHAVIVNSVTLCHAQTATLLTFCLYCSKLTAAAGSSEDNWGEEKDWK